MISYDIQEWGKPLQQAIKAQPVPQGAEVLIQVKYCGICHSDVHIRDGYFDLGGGKKFHMSERGMKPPVTMGHEPFGTVISAGPQVQNAPVGQDVLIYPWTGCGECPRCLEGMDNWCPTPRFLGIQRPGGYGQYMLVPHPRYLIDASGLDPAYAPVLACSGLTTYSAARKLMPCAPSDAIVVMGAGGLGLMAVAMLKALGHQHIVVCEIDARKWPAAQALGAQLTLDPSQPDAAAQLAALPGGSGACLIWWAHRPPPPWGWLHCAKAGAMWWLVCTGEKFRFPWCPWLKGRSLCKALMSVHLKSCAKWWHWPSRVVWPARPHRCARPRKSLTHSIN